jgi:hypothetical protein
LGKAAGYIILRFGVRKGLAWVAWSERRRLGMEFIGTDAVIAVLCRVLTCVGF